VVPRAGMDVMKKEKNILILPGIEALNVLP
jgi:hypothetical protein